MNDLWDLAARAPLMADHQVAASARTVVREMRRALDQVDGLSVEDLVGLVRGLGGDEAIQVAVGRAGKVAKAAAELRDVVEAVKDGAPAVEVAAELAEAAEAVAEVAKPKRTRKKTP